MSEETITIGGKSFTVACQDGEEEFLRTAAAKLDAEAQVLISQIGRLPESRMLLMSGLMLADKTAGAEDRVKVLEEELAQAHSALEALRSASAPAAAASNAAVDTTQLRALADRAEALADQMEAS